MSYTRADYRSRLNDKILGLEDEEYGDFDYTDSELNTYLELAVARLFPALWVPVQLGPLTPTVYGSMNFGSVTVPDESRVYMVEDSIERSLVQGWQPRPGQIVAIDMDNYLDGNPVNVYYYDAYVLPADDVTAITIPVRFLPLVIVGALIEALESRHDTGIRPDPESGHQEMQVVDRLNKRYQDLKTEMAMALPVVVY